MSIKKSQAILKHLIDLKFGVYAVLRKRNHVSWHLKLLSASSFLFPLSSIPRGVAGGGGGSWGARDPPW